MGTSPPPDETDGSPPNPDNAPFWDGAERGQLLIPLCRGCGHRFFPPMPGCPRCGLDGSDITFEAVSGLGTIYSWIVAHYAFDPVFEADLPYTIVTVDLAEGPRIFGRLTGIEPEAVREGLEVAACFEERAGRPMLHFRPTGHHLAGSERAR